MLGSGLIATYLKLAHPELLLSTTLLSCVFGSALIWLPVTLLTSPVSDERLGEFVRRVRPGAAGWARVYRQESLEHEPYLGGALLRWALAVALLFGFNFLVGGALLGRFS